MRRIGAKERITLSLNVNGRRRVGMAMPRTLLSDFLRHEVGLPGTHVGCEHGVCGACTILIDGRAERACLTFAVQAEGCELVTIEDHAEDRGLNDLQQAFSENGALQCGYCTPGIIVMLSALLRRHAAPDEALIRQALSGNICRCTGYAQIVDAVLGAVQEEAPAS